MRDHQEESSWAEKEFSGIRLGDLRNAKRFVKVADRMSLQPTTSINQACADWAATKAAYRLFDCDSVTPDEILKPHIQQSLIRAKDENILLAIQDTTYINYEGHHKAEGLGFNPPALALGEFMLSTLPNPSLGSEYPQQKCHSKPNICIRRNNQIGGQLQRGCGKTN